MLSIKLFMSIQTVARVKLGGTWSGGRDKGGTISPVSPLELVGLGYDMT